MLEKLKGYKTILIMVALAVLPALDLLGQIDIKSILLSFGADQTLADKWGEMYAVGVAFVAKALRFVTVSPIFASDKPKTE